MSKEICISTTPHETRLAILEDDELAELYYERENEYTLAGSIYKGRVTRVLPGMQSAFVDIGLERDAFLYVTDFLEEQDDGVEYDSVGGDRQRRGSARSRRSSGQQEQAPDETAPDAKTASAQSEESDTDETPAGTRRWRGRRGRGRGMRQRAGAREGGEPSREEDNEGYAPQSEPAGGASFYESVEPNEPANAALDALPGETRASRAERASLPGESMGARHESHPGNRREGRRGGFHDRRRGDRFEDRGGERHEDRESTFERAAEPSAESRILLPGESLSRHGGPSVPEPENSEPETAAPSFAPNYTAPKPATLIEAPITWDGGALLPGESRSGRAETAPAPVNQEPREAVARNTGSSAANAGEDPGHDSESEAIEPAATAEGPLKLELHEEVQEFEPEDASASHRVDAAPPSEFRISGTTESEREAAEAAHAEASSAESAVEDDEALDASEHDEQATEVADQLFGFAPGAGIIEEEVIDEEEYDFDPVHAEEISAVIHDPEELEEETLERSEPEQTQEAAEDYELAEAGADGEDRIGEDADESIEGDSTGDDDDAAVEGEASTAEPATRGRERRGRRGDRRGGRLGRRMGRGGHRPSVQTMDLPIISDLLKQGQEILLQIAKEPIARKGARVTSHIALPGRFLVFMPTVNHIGVSRKISSDEERMRLKRILTSEKGEASGGFIVRTAAGGASEEELRADLRFLISLWNDIKQREDSSKSPALIYHDLNLVERILRDQVSDNFSAIWVDSETEYERIVRFLNRFQPSLIRRVKLYTKETPLFEQFGIESEITKALHSKVWLKSGGSIVINQTEALVAIDVNTGKYVGKTARLEDTIVKTNLDAIPEIVRQIRLRDLGGIIIIDFIDMDERRNRHKVLSALEEALKVDRAPSKVLQFNDFGLVAITRKRVKQSLERTLSIPCPICTGTGMVKSPTTVANEIYIELRKTQSHIDREDIMLRVNPEVVKVLKANNARWLNELEEISGKTIIVKSDPALQPEQFDIH